MTGATDLSALFGAGEAATFLGLPACDDLATLRADVALLGVPGATPYDGVGAYCRNGPASLRRHMSAYAANVAHHHFDLGGAILPGGTASAADCGDLPFSEHDFDANRARIRAAVGAIVARGAIPLLIGGDDSIPIPMLEALAPLGPLTILQLDAHIDWRDSYRDEPLGLSSTMRRASEMAHVERIVQVGARGLGSARAEEVAAAEAWGAKIVTARDYRASGPEAVLELIPRGANVVLCFDVDVLDPAVNPAVIAPTPGGLGYDDALDLIAGTTARARIVAADFAEFLPEADHGRTGHVTVGALIAATLGLLARQD